ncbi:MAG: hypothetical protein HY870_19765, partial [Chloroflexi bacterium]|nr:hypothetical protein [Chloroflexota bacterium]
MNSTRLDSDRVILAAAMLIGLIGVALYVVLFLTVLAYGQLNINGQILERLALLLTAATMLLALYLALAARSRALTSPALSGAGWFVIAAGFMLAFPALGGLSTFAAAPGVKAFSSVAGAMFLIIGGAGLLQ